MDVQLAEAPSERKVLLMVDGLVAKEDDSVLQQSPADLGVRPVVERLRKDRYSRFRPPIAGVSGSTEMRRYVIVCLPSSG